MESPAFRHGEEVKTAPLTAGNPGLGIDLGTASAIYGIYTALVYLAALPGGWVADKLWGHRQAVFVGGCVIAAGHFTLAGPLVGLPGPLCFYLGLLLVVVGTGLLKPNVSTMVGELYPSAEEAGDDAERIARAERWGARRDAGYSVYYMGINLGAILGPFVCGTLAEKVNWHWGFSAAGFGMLLGLVQYRRGLRRMGRIGALGATDAAMQKRRRRGFRLASAAAALLIAVITWAVVVGTAGVTIERLARWLGYAIVAVAVLYFVYLLGAGGYGARERKRIVVIFWLFLLGAVFWSGFEQAGSSLNLFADRLTDRVVFGWEMPTTWLQNVNPIFIVLLAPVFGWLWTWLAARRRNPSIPVKFALGLLGLAAGFLVLAWGASYANETHRVSMAWLVVTYFLFTCGELCLSPVGLSSVTKLSPGDRVSEMMGVWFVGAALGNLMAGLLAAQLTSLAPDELFLRVALFTGGVGLLALLASRGVQRLMGHVD